MASDKLNTYKRKRDFDSTPEPVVLSRFTRRLNFMRPTADRS